MRTIANFIIIGAGQNPKPMFLQSLVNRDPDNFIPGVSVIDGKGNG